MHKYWGSYWGTWPGKEQVGEGNRPVAVGTPVGSRCHNRMERKLMGRVLGRLVELVP